MARTKPEITSNRIATLKMVNTAQALYGKPLRITSAYREGDPLAHGAGLAVDIAITGGYERKFLALALHKAGFKRIGIYDKHVHADNDTTLPEAWWVGTSK